MTRSDEERCGWRGLCRYDWFRITSAQQQTRMPDGDRNRPDPDAVKSGLRLATRQPEKENKRAAIIDDNCDQLRNNRVEYIIYPSSCSGACGRLLREVNRTA